MTRRYKSKPMAALHETMSDLHRAGAIDSGTMSEFDQRCLADAANDLSFQVFKDAKGEWRWRLVAANGRRIAGSGEGYKSKSACIAAIELVKKSSSAPIAA
jgi:uncharacterized protein YegP (UPF0339 family)